MITELFEMFNRTHTGTEEQDLKDFKKIIDIILTDFGSSMYTYMLMLEKAERKEEFFLIKDYREKIFAARAGYNDGTKTMENVHREISLVHDKLSIQVIMLRTVEGRQWEAHLFQSTMNDFPNFLHHMKDLTKFNIPQSV